MKKKLAFYLKNNLNLQQKSESKDVSMQQDSIKICNNYASTGLWLVAVRNHFLSIGSCNQRETLNRASVNSTLTNTSPKFYQTTNRKDRCNGLSFATKAKMSVEGGVLEKEPVRDSDKIDYGVVSVHHVGILCENLERSLEFYQNILGLEINEARPHDKLPYRGAWLWVGSEMIHLMELPNPDPLTGRPEHGGRDRHTCIAIRDVSKLKMILDKAGISYTLSKSGRPAIFTRDPDANALEFTQVDN